MLRHNSVSVFISDGGGNSVYIVTKENIPFWGIAGRIIEYSIILTKSSSSKASHFAMIRGTGRLRRTIVIMPGYSVLMTVTRTTTIRQIIDLSVVPGVEVSSLITFFC